MPRRGSWSGFWRGTGGRLCLWRGTTMGQSSPAAARTRPSRSGRQGRLARLSASRPWRGTTGTYLLPLALLIFKVVLFAHYPAMRSTVWSVGFDPSGKKLVSGSLDKTIRVWDATTGEPIGSPLTGHTGDVPAFPCSACSQSRGVCSLFSDTQGCQLRRI